MSDLRETASNLQKKLIGVLCAVFLFLAVLILVVGGLITADIEKDNAVLSPGEAWFDDWYTITRIDDVTFAIGEPRYWQLNYNYLLLGEERAILFDTGPGVRNIKPVVQSLTQLPVTVISSHPHYDHIGNNHQFERVAVLDVPSLRSEVRNNVFEPRFSRAFTFRRMSPFTVSEWWRPEQTIELGNRTLTAFHIPGHEQGSVALLDAERKQLFTGDFIYPGWLVAFAPTSNLEKYMASIRYLLTRTSGAEILYGAHAVPEHPSPTLPHSALMDLLDALQAIDNESLAPVSRFPLKIYPVNEDMEIYFPPF